MPLTLMPSLLLALAVPAGVFAQDSPSRAGAAQDAPVPNAASAASDTSADVGAAAPETLADGSQRWSVLADPCRSERRNDGEEILVCGSEIATRLPLPEERGPLDRPMPSNPYLTGSGALAAAAPPCATLSSGCTVGIDLFGAATALVRLAGKLVDPDSCCERAGEGTNAAMLFGDIVSGVSGAFGAREVTGERVPIDLDASPPDSRTVPIRP